MTIAPQANTAFLEYVEPLRFLENAFINAGLPITFVALLSDFEHKVPLGTKIIQITRKKKILKTVSIEGDSPAQAVKDVAQAVRL